MTFTNILFLTLDQTKFRSTINKNSNIAFLLLQGKGTHRTFTTSASYLPRHKPTLRCALARQPFGPRSRATAQRVPPSSEPAILLLRLTFPPANRDTRLGATTNCLLLVSLLPPALNVTCGCRLPTVSSSLATDARFTQRAHFCEASSPCLSGHLM
jgi:hypothetical protein